MSKIYRNILWVSLLASIIIIIVAMVAMKNKYNNKIIVSSYLTQEIISKQKLVDFFSKSLQLCLLLTFFFSLGVYFFNKQLDRLNKQRIADLFLEQEKSKERIASLNMNIESAKAESSKAIAAAEEARLKQKEAEIQLEKLRLAVADRHVPESIFNDLKNELRKYTGRKVLIRIENNISSAQELTTFVESLRKLFSESGWTALVANSGNTLMTGREPTGTKIIAFGEQNSGIAQFINKQFLSLGYRISYETSGAKKDQDLWIQIWPK